MKIPDGVLHAVEAVRDIKQIVEPHVYEHSSTQLDLPKGIAREVLAYGITIPDEHLSINEEDFSGGREEYPHITVVYGLTTKNKKDVEKAIGDCAAIMVTLGSISFFENKEKDYDVLKIEVKSPELQELHDRITKALDTTGETFKDYQPHITIAYVKRGKAKRYAGDTSFKGKRIVFSELCFSHSGIFDYLCFQ